MAKNRDIIRQCFVNLTDAIMKYQVNWMCDETWVRVISTRYPDVINSIGFSRATFNHGISMLASQCGTQNALGIFIHQSQTSCPYDSAQRRKVLFYYRQVLGKPPTLPKKLHDCKDVHVIARPIRVSMAEREVVQPLLIILQSTDHCPNNLSDHGNEDKPNEGNENNAGSSGGGGGEEEGGGNLGPIAVLC